MVNFSIHSTNFLQELVKLCMGLGIFQLLLYGIELFDLRGVGGLDCSFLFFVYIDCSAITLRDQSQFFNCGYVVPPLNAQYEEVQPDLHSLERYDFSKMPDLPWYP